MKISPELEEQDFRVIDNIIFTICKAIESTSYEDENAEAFAEVIEDENNPMTEEDFEVFQQFITQLIDTKRIDFEDVKSLKKDIDDYMTGKRSEKNQKFR